MFGAGVAVVELHGIIGGKDLQSKEYEPIFREIANDKSYKAMILDIDSPGGEVAATEVFYRSVQRVAVKKPVVAYVRGMAASGGYYLCNAAHKIVSVPSAMIGSIGVIYQRPVVEQLMGRAGIEMFTFKSGKYKDMSAFWRKPTVEESAKFQELIDSVYHSFIMVVASGRTLEPSKVKELATGEVFTARQGIAEGLVDKLGDFTDALSVAATQAHIGENPSTKHLKPKKKALDKLVARLAGGSEMSGVLSGFQLVMAGGMYYIDPAHLLWSRY